MRIFCFLLLIIRSPDILCDDSQSLKNASTDTQDERNPSVNQIVTNKDLELNFEHHLHLPSQTTYDSVSDTLNMEASTTAPAHLTISATSTQSFKGQTTQLREDSSINDDYITAYSSQCISETVTSENLQSQVIFPVKEMIAHSVQFAGHVEIPLKTSSLESDFEEFNAISDSSKSLHDSTLTFSTSTVM